MPLRVAVQMDALGTLRIAGDSTFALMLEVQERGAQIFCYEPKDLVLEERKLRAFGSWLRVNDDENSPFQDLTRSCEDLSNMDVLLMRQDPPFDLAYITATHLLEHVLDRVLIVNHPVSVRHHPEKLLVTHYPHLTPKTLIARDFEAFKRFRQEHGTIILKPLYGNGGAGIFKISQDDSNFFALLEWFLQSSKEPWIAQRYLPEIAGGDKRILLVEGKPVGAFNRVAAVGENRSNMHVGGRPVPCDLTERDLEICDTIGPYLEQQGLLFAGIDVIGDFLTEINVTSPTGIREVKRFGGADVAALVWNAIEQRIKTR